MARWRSDNARGLHALIAQFESGPGLQFDQIGAIDQLKRLPRLERTVVAIQFVVVAVFMTVAAVWLL